MAKDTNLELRKMMIYQVFPRQYSDSADFNGVTKDLERIKELGTDILYLLPIHPIGVKNRKGSLGSPYSIVNYREINPDYGSLEDFKELIYKAHNLKMKVMMDVVYNHTSRDSYLLKTHPEWFYKDKNGEFNNRVGEWWDVTDFDYTKSHELWDELIDTLCYWAKLGVDGFRCDVAPLVPKEFWKEARLALKKVNPNIILLAETIHPGFVKWIRNLGFDAMTDFETYEAFDIEYDYDIKDEYDAYITGKVRLNTFLDALLKQEGRYPKNYIKSHCLDNHDCPRFASFITDNNRRINMFAMLFFLKGATFIYAGDEALDPNLPSLFVKDVVNWDLLKSSPMPKIFKRLSALKKDDAFAYGFYDIYLNDLNVAHIEYKYKDYKLIGIFNPDLCEGSIPLEGIKGEFTNLFDDTKVVIDEKIILSNKPVIIKIKE